MRMTTVTSRGIRLPIVKEGEDLGKIVVESVLGASKEEGFKLHDRDVIAITESIVARNQGNYASIDDIALDVKTKFKSGVIGVTFPILSRNRFSILLKGIARGAKKIVLMLSYPSDEVGNSLVSLDEVDEKEVNPYSDTLSLKQYRELFGFKKHEFTGVDYVEFYQQLIEAENCECEIVFTNRIEKILDYTKEVLTCDIHSRFRSKRILKAKGATVVYGLDEILNESINGSGFNKLYGLLGSNKATEDTVKLFPNDATNLINGIQAEIFKKTGVKVEVMVYGDGAFKDPQGKIWELADPVVSPFHTEGLRGTPNEIKLKYLADNQYKDLKGDALSEAIIKEIKSKESNLVGNMQSEGTTPRQITDLLGSLCDLTSGSGDKGTPVILVQGYFDNYSTK